MGFSLVFFALSYGGVLFDHPKYARRGILLFAVFIILVYHRRTTPYERLGPAAAETAVPSGRKTPKNRIAYLWYSVVAHWHFVGGSTLHFQIKPVIQPLPLGCGVGSGTGLSGHLSIAAQNQWFPYGFQNNSATAS